MMKKRGREIDYEAKTVMVAGRPDCALDRGSSWPEIIADLDSLTETEIEYDGKHLCPLGARPAATLALRAAGGRCRRPSATPPSPEPAPSKM